MNRNKHSVAVLLTAATIPFCVSSCVDDSYDLSKDIDMTITVGGDITIPGSSTEVITLAQIMDLDLEDEEAAIKPNENGDYVIKKSNSQTTEVNVDEVHITDINPKPYLNSIQFPGTPIGLEFVTDIKDLTLKFNFDDNEIPGEIRRLSAIDINAPAELTLAYSTKSGNAVESLTLKKGFSLEFIVGEASRKDQPDYEANSITFEIRPEGQDDFKLGTGTNNRQTIIFKNDIIISSSSSLSIPLQFSRISNLPEGQGLTTPATDRTMDNGILHIDVEVEANGSAAIAAHASPSTQLTLESNIKFNEDVLVVESFTGVIDPEIDIEIDPVDITGVPDFLTDQDNHFDLYNPYIELKQTNPSPLSVNLQADFNKTLNNNTTQVFTVGSADRNDKSLILYGNATSTYYLSRQLMDHVVAPSHHIYNNVIGEGLYNLVNPIPDQISLTNIKADALQEEVTMELGRGGKTYNFETEYNFVAPVQFGRNFAIVYKDTLDGWQSDLEDIDMPKAVVKMDVTNGIPLNFTLEAVAIDVNGKRCDDIDISLDKAHIAAGYKLENGEGQSTDSEVELSLTSKENGNGLSNLDGIALQFKAEYAEGISNEKTLNENMTIQLKNVRIGIKGGITADLN